MGTLVAPLAAQSSGEKRLQSECYVEGYATTFNAPYLLYEFEDGTKIYERIDAHALDSADMSDVIMQYDHEGRVFARQSNNTLIFRAGRKGAFCGSRLKPDRLSPWAVSRHKLRPYADVLFQIYEEEIR